MSVLLEIGLSCPNNNNSSNNKNTKEVLQMYSFTPLSHYQVLNIYIYNMDTITKNFKNRYTIRIIFIV